jgi:hypothetical protein
MKTKIALEILATIAMALFCVFMACLIIIAVDLNSERFVWHPYVIGAISFVCGYSIGKFIVTVNINKK